MIQTRNVLFLLLACVIFYFLPLPFHGLWVPDEPRYAQISQEMLSTGNWAAPHFMGLRYFEKPAAGYWFIALAQQVFGQNLFGVRFASALTTTLSVLLTYFLARRLWNDPRRALAASGIYMSCALIAGQAGYANLDPQFTFWVNLSLVAFWLAITCDTRNKRVASWALVGIACGMGFMTKGFLALLLPVIVAVPLALRLKLTGQLLRYGWVAVLIAGALALPWMLAVHRLEPDYWNFFFWHEHIRRFAAEDAQHTRPFWFYLPLLVVACVPWAGLLPAAAVEFWRKRQQPGLFFLGLWFLLPLIFLSFSRGKLPTYIMPCILPLSLLIAHALINAVDNGRLRALRVNALLNLSGGIALAIGVIYVQLKKPVYHDEPLELSLIALALGCWIAGNLLAWRKPSQLWLAPALAMLALLALLPAALPHSLVNKKTPDGFVASHIDALRQSHSLLSNELGAASALAWRTGNRDITLYNAAGEVKYGLAYPDASNRQVTRETVQQWMTAARKTGSVGVVLRVKGEGEQFELAALPTDGQRFDQGELVILLYDQTPP